MVLYDFIYEGCNVEIFYKGFYELDELGDVEYMVFSFLMSWYMGVIVVVVDYFCGGFILELEKNVYIEDY